MRPLASLVAIVLLAGCAGAAPSGNAPADNAHASKPSPHEDAAMPDRAPQTLTLGIGERAALADGSHLTYLQLVNDSRCPPDVRCVWAGDAEIRLRWQPNRGAAREMTLHTSPLQGRGEKSADVGSHRITLQSLARGIAPKATLEIAPASP